MVPFPLHAYDVICLQLYRYVPLLIRINHQQLPYVMATSVP